MRQLLFLMCAVLAAGPAWAGGTTIKSTLAPITDTCVTGNCDLNGDACLSNADCNFGSASAKSKLSLTGTGQFKVQLTGVVDSAGVAASGEYIVSMDLEKYPTGPASLITIKVPVVDGKGKAEADLSTFYGATGHSVLLYGGELRAPIAVPGDCPGDNSAADITTRQTDPDCFAGKFIDVAGVRPEIKTSFKSTVVKVADECNVSNTCVWNGGVCATNADCNFGNVSPKSKASLAGDGTLKVQLKGVVDAMGADASGNYLVGVTLYLYPAYSFQVLTMEVVVDGGKGKITADVSTFLGGSDSSVVVGGAYLRLPATVPADCPGGNSPVQISLRNLDPDCSTGKSLGLVGIMSGS